MALYPFCLSDICHCFHFAANINRHLFQHLSFMTFRGTCLHHNLEVNCSFRPTFGKRFYCFSFEALLRVETESYLLRMYSNLVHSRLLYSQVFQVLFGAFTGVLSSSSFLIVMWQAVNVGLD